MNKLIVLVMTMLWCTCAIAEENDSRCLVSIGSKKPLRLQFVFPPDSGDLGKVIYQGGSGAIQVKRKSERTVEEASNGRPWEFEIVWQEITKDGIGGDYVMHTQGALIYDFRYVRKKDGKIFNFKDEPDAYGETGCVWNDAH